jgi:hypothetical protein
MPAGTFTAKRSHKRLVAPRWRRFGQRSGARRRTGSEIPPPGKCRRVNCLRTQPSSASISTKVPCGVKTGVSWIMDRALYAGTPPQKTIVVDRTGLAQHCATTTYGRHNPIHPDFFLGPQATAVIGQVLGGSLPPVVAGAIVERQSMHNFCRFRSWPEAAHQKSRCGKAKGAFRVVGCGRAGTAVHPPIAGTLRNRPDVRSRPIPSIRHAN